MDRLRLYYSREICAEPIIHHDILPGGASLIPRPTEIAQEIAPNAPISNHSKEFIRGNSLIGEIRLSTAGRDGSAMYGVPPLGVIPMEAKFFFSPRATDTHANRESVTM